MRDSTNNALDNARDKLEDALWKLQEERQAEIKWAIDDLIEAHLEAMADRIEDALGVRP